MNFKIPLSEVAEITMGQSPKGENVNECGIGFPLLNGPTEFTRLYPIPVQYTNKGVRFSKIGDILFCVRGSTTGRMNYSDQKYVIGRGLAAIRGKEGYPTSYIKALIDLNLSKVLQAATGSTFPNVSKSLLESIEVEVLTVMKANKISKIFDDIDGRIEQNNQINETLEAMAQAIFKSWFVDFDPVKAKIKAKEQGGDEATINRAAMAMIASKTDAELETMAQASPEDYQNLLTIASHFPDEMEESELGLIPKGWVVKSLDEIAEYHNGLALQKFRPESEAEYLPIVKIAELRSGEANHTEKAALDIRENSIIDDGDVVFSWSGTLLVEIWCGGKAALNQHLFKVASNEYPKWFYFYYTRHHLDEFKRIANDKAVTMGHIKRSHLKEALCVIPSEALLSINDIEHLLTYKIANRLQNKVLVELRNSLLPKLLSGEIEV